MGCWVQGFRLTVACSSCIFVAAGLIWILCLLSWFKPLLTTYGRGVSVVATTRPDIQWSSSPSCKIDSDFDYRSCLAFFSSCHYTSESLIFIVFGLRWLIIHGRGHFIFLLNNISAGLFGMPVSGVSRASYRSSPKSADLCKNCFIFWTYPQLAH